MAFRDPELILGAAKLPKPACKVGTSSVLGESAELQGGELQVGAQALFRELVELP